MSSMLMSELGGDLAALRPPSAPAMLRSLPTMVRRQLGAVASNQAVMSVCEGYSNFVMHQVGSRHLADFDRLEQAFHERAQQRNLLERLVLAVTGMNMKLRQYEVGERFAEAVVAEGGLGLLNRVWEGPDRMPSLAELREPRRWVTRVRSLPAVG
jgi:putative hydrolase